MLGELLHNDCCLLSSSVKKRIQLYQRQECRYTAQLMFCSHPIVAIEVSVSPSPRMHTSQWQSSISCTGRSSDIFRSQRHRETLEDPKLASVLWGLCIKNVKAMCLGY